MFSVCDLCFFLSKKFVLTEKSKKKKQADLCFWLCVGIVICIYFFDKWKICINKEDQKKKKKLTCVSIYDWVCDLCFYIWLGLWFVFLWLWFLDVKLIIYLFILKIGSVWAMALDKAHNCWTGPVRPVGLDGAGLKPK